MCETKTYKHVSGDLDVLYHRFKPKGTVFYLAGPFFNAPQVALIQQIEAAFEKAQVPCFSPRMQHRDGIVGPIASKQDAENIFSKNVEAINACTSIVAVFDYLQPEGLGLYACDQVEEVVISTEICLPDTGTVWELGMARAKGKDSYLFTSLSVEERKMNVMLAQSTSGIFYGINHFESFLFGRSKPEDWAGGMF